MRQTKCPPSAPLPICNSAAPLLGRCRYDQQVLAAGDLDKEVSAAASGFPRANQHLAPLCLEGRQSCCFVAPEHHAETESNSKT